MGTHFQKAWLPVRYRETPIPTMDSRMTGIGQQGGASYPRERTPRTMHIYHKNGGEFNVESHGLRRQLFVREGSVIGHWALVNSHWSLVIRCVVIL